MGIRGDRSQAIPKSKLLSLNEIKRRKPKLRWDIRAHVNTITPELLKAMKNAGCDRIHSGIEAGNDRMLKVIQKQTTIQQVKQVIQWTKAADMEVLAYFIIGQPTETADDIEDSIRMPRELQPNYVHFTIFCLYPATLSYLEGLKSGIIKKDIWKEFATHPTEDFELPYWEENFNADELRVFLVRAYKSFYSRPGYIVKNLARIRSFGEFKRKIKAGLSVIAMKSSKSSISTLSIRKKAHDIILLNKPSGEG